MYIASSQTNRQEICKMYLGWVCDRKLEGVAPEPGQMSSLPPALQPAQGSSFPGLAPRRRLPHAEDGGENAAENKGEREE